MITCYFEDSQKPVYLRHVVVDMLVAKEDKVLLVKRQKHSFLEAGKWALPGGFLERDENTRDAAAREVLEETGYQAKVVSLFRIIDRPDRPHEDRQNVAFVYLMEVVKKVSQHDKEISQTKWFKLDALPAEEKIAFDHAATLGLYLNHLKKPFNLPVT